MAGLIGIILVVLGLGLASASALTAGAGRKHRVSLRGPTLAVSAMLAGASTLVLTAHAIERASCVGAVREISVISGALAGWLILGEPPGRQRTVAATTMMFSGLALIATLG